MASLVWRQDRKKWYAYFEAGEKKHTGRPLEEAPRRKRLSKRERVAAAEEAEQIAADFTPVPIGQIDMALAADMFLQECHVGLKYRTYQKYKGTIGTFLARVGRDIPVAQITAADVRAYRDARLQTKAPYTVRNDLKCLHVMFAWLHRQRDEANLRLVEDNPVDDVASPVVDEASRKVKHFPTQNEILRMIRKLQKQPRRELLAMGLLGALAGMRRLEIIKLRIEHVDLADRIVRVWGKSKNPRPIPMHDLVHQFFMDGPLEGEYVLHSVRPYRGGEAWSPRLGAHFNTWLSENGFPFTHKQLRHFFNDSLRRDAGCPLDARLLVVGHEDEATNRIYSNPTAEEARRAVETLL